MTEKEIVIDLSKKIKFGDTWYISIGSLLLSAIIAILQILMIMCSHNWIWTADCFAVLLNLAYSIRAQKKVEKKEEESTNNTDVLNQ